MQTNPILNELVWLGLGLEWAQAGPGGVKNCFWYMDVETILWAVPAHQIYVLDLFWAMPELASTLSAMAHGTTHVGHEWGPIRVMAHELNNTF